MKIPPYQLDHFFRRSEETAERREETHRPKQGKGLDLMEADRVEVSAQGRKAQIQREMVAEIIRKIR